MRGSFPPGQGELFYDPTSGLNLELRSFYEAFLKDTGETVIRLLRCFFASNPRVPTGYRWIGQPVLDINGQPIIDEDAFCRSWPCEVTDSTSPIDVGAEYHDGPEKYPSVLLSSMTANINDLWLSHQKVGKIFKINPAYDPTADEEVRRAQCLEVGERLSGKLEISVTLKISAFTKPQRDRLTDLVIHAFVGPVRRDLYRLALNWLPNRGIIGGDEVRDYSETLKIHSRIFTFGLQSEWIDDFFYNAPNLEGVGMDISKSGPPNV